ncbi:GNAT family N-acetyltransferase [Salinithrix halophila]|uniref:GNAT family N-acetyltransferase n=1 Tax=Salinithrix halophila TaxID=1485204 RepID=A0ABV8JBW2_9BACL
MEENAVMGNGVGGVNIRELTPGDAETFRELRLRCLREHPNLFGADVDESEIRYRDPDSLARMLKAGLDQFILGAFDSKQNLIGLAGFYRQKEKKMQHKGSLWGMYIAPEARGSALGQTLLKEVLLRCRRLPGLEQIQLCVATENAPAKRLYEAMGFTVYGREKEAMKLGDRYIDEEHMVLRL